jgi:hypothetical protein
VLTVSLHLYMRLLGTGRWLGLVPASVMRFGGKQMHLKVLPVKVSPPPAPVGFITVKDRTLTPLAERFIACTRKVASSDNARAAPVTRGSRGGAVRNGQAAGVRWSRSNGSASAEMAHGPVRTPFNAAAAGNFSDDL